MNRTIVMLGDMLDRRRIPYQQNLNNENVIRFHINLPESGAEVAFMISYIEPNNNFNLAINRIARFNAPTMDAYRLINRFNADPSTYNCKMFLDSEGYVIVTCNSVIEFGAVVKQVEEYIGIAIEALDKYYPQLVEVIDRGNAEFEAAKSAE